MRVWWGSLWSPVWWNRWAPRVPPAYQLSRWLLFLLVWVIKYFIHTEHVSQTPLSPPHRLNRCEHRFASDFLKRCYLFIYLFIYLFTHLFEREYASWEEGQRERKRISNGLQVECAAQLRVWSHNPEIMTWAKTKIRSLNQLCHPLAPLQMIINK